MYPEVYTPNASPTLSRFSQVVEFISRIGTSFPRLTYAFVCSATFIDELSDLLEVVDACVTGLRGVAVNPPPGPLARYRAINPVIDEVYEPFLGLRECQSPGAHMGFCPFHDEVPLDLGIEQMRIKWISESRAIWPM